MGKNATLSLAFGMTKGELGRGLMGELEITGWRMGAELHDRHHHAKRSVRRDTRHDRMPVILPPAAWPLWLGEDAAEPEQLKAVLRGPTRRKT